MISQSVDDRTAAERGEVAEVGMGESYLSTSPSIPAPMSASVGDTDLVSNGTKRLFKSRYSAVSRFIGKTETEEEKAALDNLNDVDANVDEEALKMLLDGGIDHSLAAHIAHLFVRDPLVIFDDAVVLDDSTAMVSEIITVDLTYPDIIKSHFVLLILTLTQILISSPDSTFLVN